jgi:uncharacterized protein
MDELPALVQRAQAGDVAAYERIVRRFQDMAVAYGYATLGDFHMAEDAAQEAFTQAFFDLPSLQEPAAFAGWLRRIVFKYCDRMTRRKRAPLVPLAHALTVASGEAEPLEVVIDGELRAEVVSAIRALPEHERIATLLFYIGDYAQHEIAAFLEVPVTTVRKRLQAARRRLRQRMINEMQDHLSTQAPSGDEQFARQVTAAITAIKSGDVAQLTALLDAHPALAQARSSDGRSLLGHLTDFPAGIAGGSALVKALTEAGAAVDALALDGPVGETPLQWAVSANDIAVAEALIQAGAAVDGVGNRPPLAQALFYNQLDAAELLVRHGAGVGLEFAAGLGRVELFERFFDAEGHLTPAAGVHHPPVNTPVPPASAEPQAELLEQALVYAAINGQEQAAAELLRRGANIDALPSGFDVRLTALHWAVGRRQEAMVAFLAERGADLHVRDPQYHATALGWAEYHTLDAIAAVLRRFESERHS